MKKPLLRQLIMLSKRILYAFSLQLIFCSILLANTGNAQRKSIDQVYVSFKSEELTLNQFMKQIEKQTDFRFTFNPNLVPLQQTLDVEIKNGTVYQVLESLIRQTNLSFVQVNDNIHVKPLGSNERPISIQEIEFKEITGTVKDPTGEPLPGVTILVQGTTTGTVSDADGRFKINASEGDVLIFSFIRYASQKIEITNQYEINIQLLEDSKSLEEFVVVGYGTQKRRELTGSIATMSQESIEKLPLTTLDQRLQGQISGLQVTQTSGNPGGGVVMRIRGSGTIGNNQPLFVVDGFPIGSSFNNDLNPLSTINPNDIASIEVLKDASATAIYGSRGANGVVIITTKKGSSGKPKVELNMMSGMQYSPKKIPVLNAQEIVDLYKEARESTYIERKPANVSLSDWLAVPPGAPARGGNRVFPFYDRPSSEFGVGTDWQDEIFRPAPMNQVQVSVSGGTDNLRYLVSGEITDQQGIIIESWFKRYSFRSNLEMNLNNKIKIGMNLAPSYAESRVANTQGHFNNGSIITAALAMSPAIPVFNEDGSYGQQIGRTDLDIATVFNPVALAKEAFRYRNSGRFLGNSFLEYSPIENLKFRTTLGIDYVNLDNSNFTTSKFGTAAPQPPTANANSANEISWLNENTLTYSLIKDIHSLNVVAGFTSQKFDQRSMNISRRILPNDLIPFVVGPADGGNTFGQQWSLLSYLARANYSLKERYLFTATIRRDGSSRFGSNSKWGTFPSAAVGWIVSEENFMKNINQISELKIRGSYGVTGNFEIGNYESFALMSSGQYVGGNGLGQFTDAFFPTTIGNPDLTWENSYKTNIGIDLGLFNNRLRFTADYYQNLTKNMLLPVAIPAASGFLAALQNVGSIENKGVELAVNYSLIEKGKLKWSGNFNVAYNKNTVLSLGDFGDRIFGTTSGTGVAEFTIAQVGQPLGAFFGHVHDGIFKSQAEVDSYVNANGQKMQQRARPGDVRWRDVDGDGIITVNDRTIIGSPIPDYIFGMTNTLTFKNWDFSILMSGTQGNEIANLPLRFMTNMNGNLNQHGMMRGRWQSESDPGTGVHRASQNPNQPIIGQVDAFTAMPQNPDRFSSFYVEDGSFVRLRNVVLGYSLPQSLLSRIHVQRARVYFTGSNLFTLTNYRGFDPETNERGNSATSQGVDAGGYPLPRTIMFGINLNF